MHDGSVISTMLRRRRRWECVASVRVSIPQLDYRRKIPTIAELSNAYINYLRSEHRSAKTLVRYNQIFFDFQAFCTEQRRRNALGIDLRLIDANRLTRSDAGAQPITIHNEIVVIRQLVLFAFRR